METAALSVYHDVVNHHFEVQVEDQVAFLEYEEHMGTLSLNYTHIPEKLIGAGIFKTLVEKFIYYLKEHRYRVIPVDLISRKYFKQHPEHNKLIPKYETCF